jgi:hypothetical protein
MAVGFQTPRTVISKNTPAFQFTAFQEQQGIVDGGGNVWTFPDGVVYKNGSSYHGGGGNVCVLSNDTIFVQSSGIWYVDNGAGWSLSGDLIIGDITAVLNSFDTSIPSPKPLPSVVSGTYYVRRKDGDDSADGQTTPWRTIARANSAPAGSTIKFWGGDTFIYPTLTPGVGTTITSFGIGQAKLYTAVTLNNNTTLENVNVVGISQDICVTINGTNVSVNDCTIGGTTPFYNGYAGIYVGFATSNISIKNNNIGNIGGTQLNTSQSGFGIHTAGVGGGSAPVAFTYSAGVPTNALIEIAHNTTHDCGGNLTDTSAGGPSGIEIGNGDRAWVHDNVIYNIKPIFGITPGTDFDGLDAGDSGATNTLVERNFVYNCQGGGIITFDGGSEWGPSIVRYNLLVNNGTGTFANCAVQGLGGAGTQQIYGNTIIQTTGGAGSAGSNQNFRYYECQNSVGVIANNIVLTAYPWYAVLSDQPSNLTTTHNCWYADGAGYNLSGTVYSNYSAAKAAASWFDQNGITTNPAFVNTAGTTIPSNYKLTTGSSCLTAGVNLSVAPYNLDVGSTDFFGNSVTTGIPNIGCDAYGTP